MPGYDHRFITLAFPDLGDGVSVTMRNPRVMPPSMLKPDKDIPLGPDGLPVDETAAEQVTYQMLARMVKDWHVYDATSDEDEQPLLPLPATADSVAKLPMAIITRMSEELASAANPN